jgi:hypothetical protein
VIRLPRVALLLSGVEPAGGLACLAPLCAGGGIVVAARGLQPHRPAGLTEAIEYWSGRP